MANYNPGVVKPNGKSLWTHDDVLWFALAPLSFVISITLILIGGK